MWWGQALLKAGIRLSSSEEKMTMGMKVGHEGPEKGRYIDYIW